LPALPVAVNISARQFRQVDLAELVTDALRVTGLDARWLELELTESMIMENTSLAERTMASLAAAGIGLAIDDFGSGHSSLAYLKSFPLTKLKIDRTFIGDLRHDNRDAAIVSTIIALCEGLGLTVIAEGIELQRQWEVLCRRGCHLGQGYLFSRPVPAAEMAALLARDEHDWGLGRRLEVIREQV